MKKTLLMMLAISTLALLMSSCAKDEEDAPVAGFYAEAYEAQVGEQIKFYDNSEGVVESYSWSFPGGTPETSTEKNPTVVYNTAGFYSVSLTVKNEGGSDKKSKSDIIEVIAGPPTANFSASTTLANVGDVVELYDESTGNPTGWTWVISGPGIYDVITDQNTSFIPEQAGFYTVKLWVSNEFGDDEMEKEKYIEAYAPGLVINNTTPSSIKLEYDGDYIYIPSGESEKVYDPNNDNSISYKITTNASYGIDLSSDWETADLTNGDQEINFSISYEYFYLTMFNQTVNVFDKVVVNAGLVSETSESCNINFWDETVGLGYYKAFTNTEIQFHFAESNQYIYWKNINWSSYGSQNIILDLTYDGKSTFISASNPIENSTNATKTIVLK